MSSPVDSRWESLSAPVKAAVRWARASAHVRTGSPDGAFDSVDLLVGILLADLTESPARILLDHFGIPPDEVLARPNSPALTANALLAATEWPTGLPSLDGSTNEIFELALNSGPSRGITSLPLRELFGALLLTTNAASRTISDALTARGVDHQGVTRVYWEKYLSTRQPFAEFLNDHFSYRAPGVALPGYLADQPDQPVDLIGIGPEVDAFAHLIASKRLVPPLAVGMFGDWGSGKSYFLRSLQRRIDQVAAARIPAFHQSIVQIEFNAWQYVGGDLWASLIEHLFRNLRMSGDDSDDLLAQRQQFWVRQVQGADAEHQQAQDERLQLERAREAAASEVETHEKELWDAAEALTRARQVSPGAALQAAMAEAAEVAGLQEIADNATQLGNELDQTRNDLRSLLTPLREKKYLAFVLVVLVVTPAIAYFTRQLDLSAVSTVVWLLVSATGYVALAGRFIRGATRRVAEAQAKLSRAEQEEHERVEREVAAAQQQLDNIQSRLDSSVQREQDLAAKVAEVQRERDATTAGQVLADFITERLDSEDYRRHLGVPALVRRDLERLSRLVAAQGSAAPVPGQYAIDRIVLYIDDLDRCPTPVVIKVLEAVHLLLAFPLFVVVVAVDARWLTSSLREHYRQLAGPDASPEDYLEKIFQVPFRVQPLTKSVREQMLRALLTPSLASSGTSTTQPGDVGDYPLKPDMADFSEVVDWLGSTTGTRRTPSDAVDLTITSAELARAESVADLIGSTPRAVKRFVNVYLLVKSIGTGRGWPLPADGQLVVLLAVAIGRPELFPVLAAGGQPSEEDPLPARYREIDVSGLTGWLDLIERFRFPEGRIRPHPGKMDG